MEMLTLFPGLIYSVTSPLMLIFTSCCFMLFWVAYRHNYYYVQRNKIDTHGSLFNNALSQLFAGVYVLEITLIGLFFLVRDTQGSLNCKSQAIIMIVALILTAAYHYILEQTLSPLYELIPVTLEDVASDAERKRFLQPPQTAHSDEQSTTYGSEGIEMSKLSSETVKPESMESVVGEQSRHSHEQSPSQAQATAGTAADARSTLKRLGNRIAAKRRDKQQGQEHHYERRQLPGTSRRLEVADELGASIAGYPDELEDLSQHEREAELLAAYQDPVTREPAPVIWIPQDPAGVSEAMVRRAKKYGRYLQYSTTGAYLAKNNRCEVTQPAPDVRPDWLLEWGL